MRSKSEVKAAVKVIQAHFDLHVVQKTDIRDLEVLGAITNILEWILGDDLGLERAFTYVSLEEAKIFRKARCTSENNFFQGENHE